MTALADIAVPQEERERRLSRVLGRARTPVRLMLTETTPFAMGGIVLIVLGWLGTSRTVLVAGQIPYVVSGGLLGLGLVFLGGFLYFGYWLALSLRDNRERGERQDSELVRMADG